MLWSLVAVFLSYVFWKLLVGGGVRKRKRFVDVIMSKHFPEADDDPLTDPDNMFRKDWARGTGYTNEVDQPMCSKATEFGVALFYICCAEKKPFVIPWDRVTQIRLIEKADRETGQSLARLYVSGLGMELYIPWDHGFTRFVPERVGFSSVKEA